MDEHCNEKENTYIYIYIYPHHADSVTPFMS